MKYKNRFLISFFSSFLILFSYSLILKLSSQMNGDIFFAIVVGSLICGITSGLIGSALIKNNNIMMILLSQVLSIIMVGVVWRL